MLVASRYQFDVFISYSHRDRAWVHEWLVPKFRNAGLRVCLDEEDFVAGRSSADNMRRAVALSRKTILVMSAASIESRWVGFEALLAQTEHESRLIPLKLAHCAHEKLIGNVTYLNFTDEAHRSDELRKLLVLLSGDTPLARGSVWVHHWLNIFSWLRLAFHLSFKDPLAIRLTGRSEMALYVVQCTVLAAGGSIALSACAEQFRYNPVSVFWATGFGCALVAAALASACVALYRPNIGPLLFGAAIWALGLSVPVAVIGGVIARPLATALCGFLIAPLFARASPSPAAKSCFVLIPCVFPVLHGYPSAEDVFKTLGYLGVASILSFLMCSLFHFTFCQADYRANWLEWVFAAFVLIVLGCVVGSIWGVWWTVLIIGLWSRALLWPIEAASGAMAAGVSLDKTQELQRAFFDDAMLIPLPGEAEALGRLAENDHCGALRESIRLATITGHTLTGLSVLNSFASSDPLGVRYEISGIKNRYLRDYVFKRIRVPEAGYRLWEAQDTLEFGDEPISVRIQAAYNVFEPLRSAGIRNVDYLTMVYSVLKEAIAVQTVHDLVLLRVDLPHPENPTDSVTAEWTLPLKILLELVPIVERYQSAKGGEPQLCEFESKLNGLLDHSGVIYEVGCYWWSLFSAAGSAQTL